MVVCWELFLHSPDKGLWACLREFTPRHDQIHQFFKKNKIISWFLGMQICNFPRACISLSWTCTGSQLALWPTHAIIVFFRNVKELSTSNEEKTLVKIRTDFCYYWSNCGFYNQKINLLLHFPASGGKKPLTMNLEGNEHPLLAQNRTYSAHE